MTNKSKGKKERRKWQRQNNRQNHRLTQQQKSKERQQLRPFQFTAVRRHCTDWYEIWALTDHEIYYIKIKLDLRKFSNGPFSETEKAFWVNPTPGGSQCTGLSPTLSWKWPRATLLPSFGPFFERNHSFGVKMVSENFWKTFKSCPCAWFPAKKKKIYCSGKIDRRTVDLMSFFNLLVHWKKP